MIDIYGELFSYIGKADCICITTNGFVKRDGSCVMGRGCAKEARDKWPGIDKILGKLIIKYGNITNIIMETEGTIVCAFPVKHNWYEQADLKLINESAKLLIKLADDNNWSSIIIPRPGCGNGKLSYEDHVKPLLETLFDDRFTIITNINNGGIS